MKRYIKSDNSFYNELGFPKCINNVCYECRNCTDQRFFEKDAYTGQVVYICKECGGYNYYFEDEVL